MLTKNKNEKILRKSSCPKLANPAILVNIEEIVKMTADPPKIPSKKSDFHVCQMSEKTNESSTTDMSRFRKNIEINGYSKDTTEITISSWKNKQV